MVWLVVVSITNLGFGDIVPISPGGRVFVGVASILGEHGITITWGARERFMALLGAKELQCAHRTIVIPQKNITYCTYDWCNERLARYSRK